ncbi:hypothetical protein HYY75_07475, partial [bacterium]|nr:hypothetical protein [bacterium]
MFQKFEFNLDKPIVNLDDELMRNEIKKFLVVLLFGQFLFSFVGITFAGSLKANLDLAHDFWEKKKYTNLISWIQKVGSFGAVEDIRLFLLAESLHQLGRENDAEKVFNSLFRQFPGSLGAGKGAFPFILLKSKRCDPTAFPKLLQMARNLPTAYQKGRALEELSKVVPLSAKGNGFLVIEALRAYRSSNGFYKNSPDSVGLLRNVINSIRSFQFTIPEWIEIVFNANQEGLGKEMIRVCHSLSPLLGKEGTSISMVLEADALRSMGNTRTSLERLNSLLGKFQLSPFVKSLAYKVRGDLMHFSGLHFEAVKDYRKA